MKILLLSSNIGLFGAEGVILNLMRHLPTSTQPLLGNFYNQQNPHQELAALAIQEGFPVRQIPCRGPFDPKALKQLGRIIKEDKIDLLHSHGYKADFYGFWAAKLNRRPVVSTMHSFHWYSQKEKYYLKTQEFLYRYFAAIVCVSEELRHLLVEAGIKASKLRVIDNGIDLATYQRTETARLAMRQKLALPPDAVLIGAAGRLNPEKGFDILLQAAAAIVAQNPQAFFLIAGSGPEEAALKAQAAVLNLTGKVKFLGLVEKMNDFYSALDVFVLSSLNEGLPLVILEAMASSLPIVATQVGALDKVIVPGESGLLVPAGDPQALSAALAQILADQAAARKFGQAAQKIVAARFSAPAMAQQYQELYQTVLEGRSHA